MGKCGCQRPKLCTETAMVGTWTSWRTLNYRDQQVFCKAIDDLVGATYVPLYVKTQLVSGTNYLFLAQKFVMNGNCYTMDLVFVEVYVDLQGQVTLLSITSIDE